MLLVFRGLWNDGTSASMYREIMLRNKSIFKISTLVFLIATYYPGISPERLKRPMWSPSAG
jgi:hypothetical protein